MLRNAQQRFWETIYTDLLDEAFYEAIHCALTALVVSPVLTSHPKRFFNVL